MVRKRLRLLSYMVGGFPLSLFERIADVLDADLTYDETRSGPGAGHDPFAEGEADLGWVCSTSFLDLSRRSPDPSVRLAGVAWTPDDPDAAGRPAYFADVVTTNPAIRSLDDLAGRSFACSDQVSLSGHLALRSALRDLDRDLDDFVDLCFTGGQRRSLELLVAGQVDAAVVDSVVRRTVARADDRVGALHQVARIGPWPTQPLVASVRLPSRQIAEIRAALLASNGDEQMRTELADACLLGFTAVEADHCAPVEAVLRRG